MGVACRVMKSSRWQTDPSYEYYQMSKQQIVASWEHARDLGTELHRDIEIYLNASAKLEKEFLQRSIGPAHKLENLESECDTSVERRDFLAFLKFASERGWRPYRTEWRIWDAELRVAGTIDFVA